MHNARQTPEDGGMESAVRSSAKARLSAHEISYMVALAVRLPAVYLAARDKVKADLFAGDETRYVLLWRSVEAAAGTKMLPGDDKVAKELVAVCVAAELETDLSRTYYTPSVERAVLAPGGLLDEVYALPVDATLEDKGYDLLGRFLTERKLADPFRRGVTGMNGQEVMSDPAALIKALQSHMDVVSGLGVDPGADMFVDDLNFRPPGAKIVTTQIGWLDELLGGGHAEAECYTLLAPTGGGKTVLANQIAIEGATYQSALAAEFGPENAGYWYYFTWELSKDQMRERSYAYAARVHHDTFKEDPLTRAHRPFSTAEDPASINPYEYEPYVNSPGNPFMGEKERIVALNKRMTGRNSRLKVIDYSGSLPGVGNGGLQEAITYLNRETLRGRRIAGVVIDYAGLAVQRYMASKNMKPDMEYNLLARFVNEVRSQIAVPMKCPTWVLQQLKGEAMRKAPGAKIHHTEASGCQNFSVNADFAIQLTSYNRTTGLLTAYCTKTRRTGGLEDGVIVKFDGRFAAFLSPDQKYIVDPSTRAIVPADFINTLPTGPSKGGPPPVDPRFGL